MGLCRGVVPWSGAAGLQTAMAPFAADAGAKCKNA